MSKPFLVPMSQVPGYWRVGNRYGQELRNSPLFRSKEEAQKWIDEHPEAGSGNVKMSKTTGRGRMGKTCDCGAPAYPGKDRCASCAFADNEPWSREVVDAEVAADNDIRVKALRVKYKSRD